MSCKWQMVAVIVQELYPLVTKTAYTDSQAAEAILTCDGGSWRIRHLRLCSSFARQSIAKGDWAPQHVPGDQMLADLGTKALNAPRLEGLKELMSMGSIEEEKEDESEKRNVRRKKRRFQRRKRQEEKKKRKRMEKVFHLKGWSFATPSLLFWPHFLPSGSGR